jgi:hypothetical protein
MNVPGPVLAPESRTRPGEGTRSAICCPTKLVTRFDSAGNQRVPAVALPFLPYCTWTAVVTSWGSWGSGREALSCHLAL